MIKEAFSYKGKYVLFIVDSIPNNIRVYRIDNPTEVEGVERKLVVPTYIWRAFPYGES